MSKHLFRIAFVAGLAVIAWVAATALRTNPLAVAMTVLIGAFYLMGALELWRHRQTTAALDTALEEVAEPPASIGDWLVRVPAELRDIVRLRIDGERVALPGPALAPTLAGLLVLLGMLGTFLGMVVTLSGTGVALERATDLQTMRDSLAAPVKGLGLAFGTSVAGVAASAMLGLMSALCRRERLQVAQRLDTRIATTLHGHTRAHQRQEAFRLLQQQAQLMPALVEQLQATMARQEALARQSGEQLLASQARFQVQAESAYRGLASSVDQSLRQSLSESARVAAATIQPAVEATMQGIARETTALHGLVANTVQQQLEGLSSRVEASTQRVADTWAQALSGHERRSEALAQRLETSLDGFGRIFEQRSASLLQTVSESHATLNERTAQAMSAQLDAVATRLDATVSHIAAQGQGTAVLLEQQSAALLLRLDQAHTALESELAARDTQRLSAWTDTLAGMAAALQREWQQVGAQTARQQAQICQTLEQTASHISTQTEAHARSTISEIARLVQTASEAPRAAADVVAQLREKLSDSMARDNGMLEERSRIMGTLNTLLDAVQHSSTAQKSAIDQLVGSTADWLQQAGSRFTEKVDAESARMESMAAQLTSSAVEVASLGEAFGAAVEGFSQSSEKLMAHLQRIDETLGKSIARSDEQLAYYVAQAREVIDLSLTSQKQIVEDLQRVAGTRGALVSEA